jgi:alpha-L-fucosidase
VEGGEFSKLITSADEDLGSRKVIRHAGPLVWYPAEVNTSIRPGWFYHLEEDSKVRSLGELLEIYYQSVGGNATFLLNIPPDTRGRFHENDATRLFELGAALRAAFEVNVAASATITATESLDDAHRPHNALSTDHDAYWRPHDGTESADITLRFADERILDKLVLMEHIASGQRIESFTLACEHEGQWMEFYSGGVVGYKRICRFDAIRTGALRVRLGASRGYPTLAFIGAYAHHESLPG